ncbi:MAG: DUF4145 domain-containing protein [Taibaiella sp.]|nr:DUF4145 domain-containing protein [Taibaiella sp.]
MRLNALTKDDTKITVEIDQTPNNCPYCHRVIISKLISSFAAGDDLRIVFRCPNDECEEIFIGMYTPLYSNTYSLSGISAGNFSAKKYSITITEISPVFIEIYNQAEFAEQNNLIHISGVGYRKALEFLIKDYLILLKPEDEEQIKKKPLGNCIKESVDNKNLKTVAERATWLGNDEAHYIRRWVDKDITDLKRLIDLSVHWIEMEIETKKYLEGMP